MEVYLKKYFWAVNLLTIALGATFAAKTTSHALDARLMVELPPPAHLRRPARLPEATIEKRDYTFVATRNVFCSTCAPPPPPVVEDTGSTDDTPVASTLPLALVATIVSDDSAWSFALLRDNAGKKTGLFRTGSIVMAAAELAEVQVRRVYLRNNGHMEYLDLEGLPGGANVAAVPKAAPADSVVAMEGGPSNEEMDQNIKKVSETQYDVTHGLIDKMLGDPSFLARSARIVPSIKDGKPDGFKVYAIRPGSVYAKIGLSNGDTIHAINGHEITSPDKALEVYTKVRNASHITVSLSRRGDDKTLDYNIR